jgi:hypothetical protein
MNSTRYDIRAGTLANSPSISIPLPSNPQQARNPPDDEAIAAELLDGVKDSLPRLR